MTTSKEMAEMQEGLQAIANFMPEITTVLSGTLGPNHVAEVLNTNVNAREHLLSKLNKMKALVEKSIANVNAMTDEQVKVAFNIVEADKEARQTADLLTAPMIENRRSDEFRNRVREQMAQRIAQAQENRQAEQQAQTLLIKTLMKEIEDELWQKKNQPSSPDVTAEDKTLIG